MSLLKQNLLVSIIMPAYNAEKTIEVALKSLIVQTYPYWECIVVDDGSADSTSRIVESIANIDSRVKLFKHITNKGRSAARQNALNNCTGDYVAMLDSDDFYMHNKLEKQVSVLQKYPDVDFVSSMMFRFNDLYETNRTNTTNANTILYDKIVKGENVKIAHAPSLIKRSILSNFTFDNKLKRAQDYDLMLYLAKNYRYAIIEEELYGYRYDSQNLKNFIKGYYYQALVVKKYSKINFLKISIINSFKVLYRIVFGSNVIFKKDELINQFVSKLRDGE